MKNTTSFRPNSYGPAPYRTGYAVLMTLTRKRQGPEPVAALTRRGDTVPIDRIARGVAPSVSDDSAGTLIGTQAHQFPSFATEYCSKERK